MASGHSPHSPVGERPTQVRWLVFALACATSWLFYMHRYAWGAIKPALQREYPQFQGKELGWLDSVFSITYAIGQIPGGLAGDRFGPRAVVSLLIVLWSATVAWMGLAQGAWGIVSARLSFGLAQAGVYPNLGKVTRSWFPLSIRTWVQGAVGSFSGRAGGACAPIIVATVLMATWGYTWRGALLGIAVLGGALAVLFGLLFRDSPLEHPWSNQAEGRAIGGDEKPATRLTRPVFVWNARNTVNISMLMVHNFASAFADNLFVFWIPLFLVQEKGLSEREMGIFASLPLWGGALGGLTGGALNDWVSRVSGNRRVARSSVACFGKTLAAVLIAASVPIQDGRLAMLVLLACKFFSDWSQPTVWGTVTDIGGRAAGTVFGAFNMCGSVGVVIAGPVMGAVADDYGWSILLYGVGGMHLLAALPWLFIDCTKPLVVERGQAPAASGSVF